jgi:hypothetical protein
VAQPDAHVEPLVDQRDDAIEEEQTDVHLRPVGKKAAHDRQDVEAPEHHRGGHVQQTARLARGRRLQLREVGQNAPACLEIAGTRVGQRHRTGCAVQQTRRQVVLERGNRARHGSGRAAEPAGGIGEATVLGDRRENRPGLQPVHLIVPKCETQSVDFEQLNRTPT